MNIIFSKIKLNALAAYRAIRISTQVILSLFLGILVSLVYLQEDKWFKDLLQNKINAIISQTIKTPLYCKIRDINLVSGAINLDFLSASNDKWSLDIPVTTVDLSYRSIIFKKKCEFSLIFHNAQAYTQADENEIYLATAIRSLLEAPSSIPLSCISCQLRQSKININYKNEKVLSLIVSAENFADGKSFKSRVNFHDGFISNTQTNYVQKILGNLFLNYSLKVSKIDSINAQITFGAPILNKFGDGCSLNLDYKDSNGLLSISNHDKTIAAQFNNILFDKSSLEADLTLNCELKKPLINLPIDGQVTLNSKIGFKNKNLNYVGKGQVIFSGLLEQSPMSIDFLGDQNRIRGHARFEDPKLPISSNWSYDFKNFKANISQKNPITINSFSINKINKLNCDVDISSDLIKFNYLINFTESIKNKTNKLSGHTEVKNNICKSVGNFNSENFELIANITKRKIEKLIYKSKDNYLINLKETNNILVGFLKDTLIKDIAKYIFDYDLRGSSDLKLKISNIFEKPKLKFALENSNIRLPYTYNIIKNITGIININLSEKKIFLNDLSIKLHKGEIKAQQITANNTKSGWYIHAPISLSECLISLKKDFLAVVSGMCLVNYDPERKSFIKGNIVLESSFLKGNIFSSKVQKDIISTVFDKNKKDLSLDVSIESKDHMKIKTTFLEAESAISIKLAGTVLQPEISGKIDVLTGKFYFPYKPLYINQGKIILNANQDPIIDLTAKNTIKKYGIKMHISGTTKQPQINFESSPPLQKEQIITLLLAGSEEGSVFLVMPQMITQAFETLLFGSEESYSKMQRTFKNFLKPLKYVRIIPNISGKEIKGGIEVSFNDKLRASIQNNLDLSDETQMKLEYAVSDDINIRGVKDEQGNVSGEVEMRWKF